MLIPRGALRTIWQRGGDPMRTALAPAASDRAFWDAIDQHTREVLIAEAQGARSQPWPRPLLSQWADYARTGDRAAYEAQVFTRDRRVRLSVLAAAIEPNPERIRDAADGLWLVCEQSTWCWPAHDDAFARGLRVPDRERPFVDLGAGEEVALLAWSTLVLGEHLDAVTPGLTRRMADEARQRVLSPFVERRDWPWEGSEERVHNWAPWIHGNLLPAAIAFAEPELRDRVLSLSVDGLDRYLAQLPADGAIDEGFSYWWQGAARAFDALSLLDPLTGGAVTAAVRGGPLGGLRELARFPDRMQIGHDWFAGFSDATARVEPGTAWHALFRAADLVGSADAAALAVSHRADAPLCGLDVGVSAGLGRMLAELADPHWRAAPETPPPLPERVWLPSIGVGLRREHAGSVGGLSVVVTGGHNDDNHNHNDLGAVAIAVDGIPLLPDLGRATYTAQTFSERRYELWNVGSPWHTTALPQGQAQSAGPGWVAPLNEIDGGWQIDLSRAYPGLEALWTRTVLLHDGAVRIIDDSPALRHPHTRIIVVCVGVPEATPAGWLVPGREGGRGLLLEHDPARIELEITEVDDPYLTASWGDRVTRMLFTPASGDRWELTGSAR